MKRYMKGAALFVLGIGMLMSAWILRYSTDLSMLLLTGLLPCIGGLNVMNRNKSRRSS